MLNFSLLAPKKSNKNKSIFLLHKIVISLQQFLDKQQLLMMEINRKKQLDLAVCKWHHVIDCCLQSVEMDEGCIDLITIKIIDCLGLVHQYYFVLAIVSKSHDCYLAHVCLSKVTQCTIIELAAPRVECVLVFYVSVLCNTFLVDTFYPLKNKQSFLNRGSIILRRSCCQLLML